MRSSVLLLTVTAALALNAPSAGAREGFGIARKTATLVRINPPKVFLMGTRISVKATSQSSLDQALAERIRSQLESELISADGRLTVDAMNPEVLTEVSVLQDDYNEDWQKRKEIQRRQVGKDAKGKPVWQDYEVEVSYKAVSYAFRSAYKVTDLVKGKSLDADSIRFDSKKDYREGSGAPQKFELENSGAAAVVSQIVPRLTPSREKIGVLLPKGSLEDFLRLAENGLWNKYLEALEGLPEKPKPADEAYRQYALGTAYEALGYGAEDPATTLKYLEQAATYYNRALESNPEEKFFSKSYDSFWTSKSAPAPLERVKEALTDYRRIVEFRESYAKLQVAKSALPIAGGKSLEGSSPERPSNVVDNVAVIQMVRSGLPENVILTAINDASQCRFDVSPKRLVELSEAKVSVQLIQRMQEMTGKGSKPPAKSKPAPKATKSKWPGSPGNP